MISFPNRTRRGSVLAVGALMFLTAGCASEPELGTTAVPAETEPVDQLASAAESGSESDSGSESGSDRAESDPVDDAGVDAGTDTYIYSGVTAGDDYGDGAQPTSTTIDLSLEESPEAQTETFTEQLEESGFLETAAEPQLEVMAQNSCDGLADTIVDQYQTLLVLLGDAGRDDTSAIDTAFESPVLDGQLISRRADEIGCDDSEVTAAICRSLDLLQADGDVGRDIVALLGSRCS